MTAAHHHSPASKTELDDYELALKLQQEEGWPSTPETIAADERLARQLQEEENARLSDDD